jgi:hypothetical protein
MTKKRPARKRGSAPEAPEMAPEFAPVVTAFAGDRAVTMKRMFSSNSVLTVKGKIFAMLVKGRLVAKLPRERVDALVASGAGTHFDPGHGRLMKEWVTVPIGGIPWVPLAQEAYRFVRTGRAAG